MWVLVTLPGAHRLTCRALSPQAPCPVYLQVTFRILFFTGLFISQAQVNLGSSGRWPDLSFMMKGSEQKISLPVTHLTESWGLKNLQLCAQLYVHCGACGHPKRGRVPQANVPRLTEPTTPLPPNFFGNLRRLGRYKTVFGQYSACVCVWGGYKTVFGQYSASVASVCVCGTRPYLDNIL